MRHCSGVQQPTGAAACSGEQGNFVYRASSWQRQILAHIERTAQDLGARRSVFDTRTAEAAERIELPVKFLQLVLAIEDKRFWLHVGVDPLAVLRALQMWWEKRGRLQGGSTIPEQLAKLMCPGVSSRTFLHRLSRSMIGLALTLTHDKFELLRTYLKHVYFGASYYGVHQATLGYFGKPAYHLTTSQAFFLTERIALPNSFRHERVLNILRREIVREILGEEIHLLPSVYGQTFGSRAEMKVKQLVAQAGGVPWR